MPTVETSCLALEALLWVKNVRKNMRDNASAYRAAAVAQTYSVARIAGVMNADANEFLRTLQALDTITGDVAKRTKLLDGLSVFGISGAEATANVNELETAATSLRDASKATYAEIIAACDAMLGSVADYTLPVRG